MTQANNCHRLDGKVAVVTGAGTGLGLATSKCLAEAGAHVVLIGRRLSVLEAAALDIGRSSTVMPFDVTETARIPALVATIEKTCGRLDILVNNAGIHLRKPARETTEEEFAAVLESHVMAPFALAREAAGRMMVHRAGSIVFVGSMAALMGVPGVAAYSAAKSAVLGLTRALAVEWAEFGIRVNAVIPGWIDSGMARVVLEKELDRKSRILSRTPMGRLGAAEEVGMAITYLCSPAAAFVTGTSLTVDGGAAIGF